MKEQGFLRGRGKKGRAGERGSDGPIRAREVPLIEAGVSWVELLGSPFEKIKNRVSLKIQFTKVLLKPKIDRC